MHQRVTPFWRQHDAKADANMTPSRRQHDAPEAETENPTGFDVSASRVPSGPEGPAARSDKALTWAELAAILRDGYINDYPTGTRFSEIDPDHLRDAS